jgi:hypothetical protein
LLATGPLKGSFTEDDWMPFKIPVELRQQSDEEVKSIMSSVLAGPKQKPKKKCPKVKKNNGHDRKP